MRGRLVAVLLCAGLVGALTSAAEAASTPPSSFPAAGPVVWPSVGVRTAPRMTAKRKMVLRELRSDFRPQIVLALAARRIGAVAPAKARLTMPNTSGAPALVLTAREGGLDGNRFRVTVQDPEPEAGTDDLVISVGTSELFRFPYNETDLASLAAFVNASAAPVTATVVGSGPLYPILWTSLAGGHNGNPGQLWYKLNLPIRPFGQTGWVPADAVDVRPTKRRVVLHRASKVLEVFQGTRRIYRARVAVGRPDRKTPLGRFYVAAKYVPPRNALVSTYALELSAPAGLPDFLRGGVVGIHGTPATWSIGRAASNGCIRVRPSTALHLRRLVPLGTPVHVRRR